MKFEKNLKNFCKEKWQFEKNYPILHKIPLQEILLKMYCDRIKIHSIPFFPASKIWREKNRPRLNDKFLMYLFVIKRLIKRKLMRFKS